MFNSFSALVKKLIKLGGLSLLTLMVLSCSSLKMHGFGGYRGILTLSPENVVIDGYYNNEAQKENFIALFNSMERSRFEGITGTGTSTGVRVRINEQSIIKDSGEVFPETINSIIIDIEVFNGGTMSAGYTLIDTTTESLASPRYMERVIKTIMEQLHG